MLRSIKELQKFKLLASDGEIGKVEGFYFDDNTWTIRYLVADTGHWLRDNRVLISPFSLAQPNWPKGLFPVNLTKSQIENSPDVDTDVPVSRQHEAQLSKYYNWPVYWMGNGMIAAGTPMFIPPVREESRKNNGGQDSHLRITKEVMTYHIKALDGELGHVEDFIVDDETWILRYMVVDTKNWWKGKQVLIAPGWIRDINWVEAQVDVGLMQDEIKKSPEYHRDRPVSREYEEQLYEIYGRPKYWA